MKLFEKHNGNYDAIFAELDAPPEGLLKAKRRGTSKAEQFAREVRALLCDARVFVLEYMREYMRSP